MRLKYFYLLILLCLIASCRKDTGPSGPRLIKSMSIQGNDCVINYTYDDDDRVLSVTQCDTVDSYTYYDDSLVNIHTIPGINPTRNVYAVNKEGIATALTRIASDGSVTHFSYTYDADGHRISMVDDDHSNTFLVSSFDNGNDIYDSSVSTLSNAANFTIHRTYYLNTDNTAGSLNFGKAFLGTSSANFVKSEILNEPNGQYIHSYTYTLDHLNGVETRITKLNDSIIETREYEYYGSD